MWGLPEYGGSVSSTLEFRCAIIDDSVLLLRRQQDDAKSWFGDRSSALTQFCFQLAYPFFRQLA